MHTCILCNSYEPLEGQLPDEELSGFLVTPDLTESDSSRPVAMGFLDTSCGRCTLASGFGGQLFPWGLSSSGFPGSLLGTSHCFVERELSGR